MLTAGEDDREMRGRDVVMTGEAKRLADIIDSAPDGTPSALLLETLKPALQTSWRELEIIRIYSIHEFLSDIGTQEEWRRAYGNPRIACVKGRWSMPPSVWQRIGAALRSCGIEGSFRAVLLGGEDTG